MTRIIGLLLIVLSLASFGLLTLLGFAVYIKFTIAVFGVGSGLVLVFLDGLLRQFKENDYDSAAEPNPETSGEEVREDDNTTEE